MTQWSDDPANGAGAAGPPPNQYGPPAPPYRQPAAQQPVAQGYSPYGRPGQPFGPKPPRETGALVVCVVLLVLALIGCFVASAAVYGNLTSDSASAVSPQYGVQSGGASGSSSGGIANSGGSVPNGSTTSASSDPEAVGKRLVAHFPLFPGARQVSSSRPYLPKGAFVDKYGKKYVVHASPNRVYNWYLTHLSRDHLQYGGSPSTIRDRDTGKILDSYGTITSPLTTSVNGNFNIETGRYSGLTVLTVVLYA